MASFVVFQFLHLWIFYFFICGFYIYSFVDLKFVDIELKLQDSFALSNTIQENKAICAIRRNPKYFFTYVK